MAALAEVGREVSATLDLSIVLEKIADRAKALLSADTSAVFLPQPDGDELRATVALGRHGRHHPRRQHRPGRGGARRHRH